MWLLDYDVRDEDKFIQNGASKNGKFYVRDIFKALTGEVIDMGWTKVVWFKHNISRQYLFISCLSQKIEG